MAMLKGGCLVPLGIALPPRNRKECLVRCCTWTANDNTKECLVRCICTANDGAMVCLIRRRMTGWVRWWLATAHVTVKTWETPEDTSRAHLAANW
jgi:hypothetical protein